MTTLQERFVEEYLVDYNGAAACRRAGYSVETARQEAYKLLQNKEVKAAIKERLDLLSMSGEEAIQRLTDWGRGNFKPFIQQDAIHGMTLDLSGPEAMEHIGLIRKIKQTKRVLLGKEDDPSYAEYTTEIELHDAKDAVDKIAKIRGLYIDKGDSGVSVHLHFDKDDEKV